MFPSLMRCLDKILRLTIAGCLTLSGALRGVQVSGYGTATGWRRWVLVAVGGTLGLHAGIPTGSIDAFIKSEMPVSGVPGLAYAVVAEGEIESAGARGVVRMGTDREVTPDTAFLSGSIAKSFTALAVMQLVEAGAVDLNREIAHYLTGFSGQSAGPITIRQLLSHTSGLSTLQGNDSHADDAPGKAVLARRVEQLAGVVPVHPPGTRWEYSNLNYQILGRLVEVVSGRTYQAYIKTHILNPVGMTHSFVADGEIHDDMATGHRPWFGTRRPLDENRTDLATAPQGGIVASANDLARYLMMMMNGEDDVLSAEGKAAMMRPASEVSPFYGFGWFVDSGTGTVSHTGKSPGFETLATMIPAQRKGAVVLVNGGSGIGFDETMQLRNGIVARALGLEYHGEGSRLFLKILFVTLVLTPGVFLFSMIWAWRHRQAIRAKTGVSGRFSLWFPLFTTSASAWVIFSFMPSQLGASFATLNLFQPDLGLALIATPVTGVLWAGFRLGVAYSGKTGVGGMGRGD